MQQRFAAREDETIHAGADHRKHAHGPLEIELLFGLRIAPRAEVFAVGAVEVALRGDVVSGDQRVQHTIAAGEFGEVKEVVGGGGRHRWKETWQVSVIGWPCVKLTEICQV